MMFLHKPLILPSYFSVCCLLVICVRYINTAVDSNTCGLGHSFPLCDLDIYVPWSRVYLCHAVWHVVGGNRVLSAQLTAFVSSELRSLLTSKGYVRTSRILRVFGSDVVCVLQTKEVFCRATKTSGFILVRS